MNQKIFLNDKGTSLTHTIKNDLRLANKKYRYSQGELELKKMQTITKVQHSRLKSTHLDLDSQSKQPTDGILNDHTNIEQISLNHMRLSKLNQEMKFPLGQCSFNDTSNTTREKSSIAYLSNSLGRSSLQNSTQIKFFKIDQINTTSYNSFQQSGYLALQQQDSFRSMKTSPFALNYPIQTEDQKINSIKRKISQLGIPNIVLKDINQPNSIQKEECVQTQNNESNRSVIQGSYLPNQGNIIQFAAGNSINNKSNQQSSQLINSKELEKINILRKEGVKMKPNENFYMQLISNDEMTLPQFEKDYLSLKRERYLENTVYNSQEFKNNKQASQEIKNNKFNNQELKSKSHINLNPLKTISNLFLEDGSMLDLEKMKTLTNNCLKNHKLSFHNSQNNGFRKSDERKDSKILSQWLDDMINRVYTEQITSYYDFYEKFELIFDGVISEICRQLQPQCSERSQLLRKVWSIYSTIIGEFFLKTQKTNIQIETENFKRVNNVHKMYLNDIKSQNNHINELLEKLDNKENYMNKLRSENSQFQYVNIKRYLRKKWKKLETGNQLLKSDLEQQLENCEQLVKENQILKMKIEGLIMNEQNEFFDQFNRNEYKDKFNDEIEKIRNKMFEHFTQLYEEQKSKLEAVYNVRQDLKEKEALLAQKIEDEDAEYEKNRLNIPRVDQDAFDDMILDNKCIDTSDLFTQESKSVDTSNLTTYQTVETQATPEPIKQVSRQVQATVKTVSQDAQVDLRTLQQNNTSNNYYDFKNQSLSNEHQRELEMLNDNFTEYISQKYLLKCSKLEKIKNIDQLIVDFNYFKQGFGEVLQHLPMKEEFSYNDTVTITGYLDQNINQITDYLSQLFNDNKNQKSIISESKISIVQNRIETIINSNRVVLYHLYLQIHKSTPPELNLKKEKSDKQQKIDSQTSLDGRQNQQKEQPNIVETKLLRKSSFFKDKFKSATKKLFTGIGFYKTATEKRISQEEKMETYQKYQAIAEEFEHKQDQKRQSILISEAQKFKFDTTEIGVLNGETQKQDSRSSLVLDKGSLILDKQSSHKITSMRKVSNSSISENSGEDSKSEESSVSIKSPRKTNNNNNNNNNKYNKNQRHPQSSSSGSSSNSNTESASSESISSTKKDEQNDKQYFKFINKEDNSKQDNENQSLVFLNVNSTSPQRLSQRGPPSLSLSPTKQLSKKSSLYEFQDQLSAPKQLIKIKEDNAIQQKLIMK